MYKTKSTEQAIQVIGGVMPGENTVRLGENVPMSWKYEFRMEDAIKELGLTFEEKMTLLSAREYIYSKLDFEDLPEPVKIWREAQDAIKKEMDEFNSFMAEIASDAQLNQPTLVAKAKKYFPSRDINNKMKIKDIVNFILYGVEPPKEVIETKKATKKWLEKDIKPIIDKIDSVNKQLGNMGVDAEAKVKDGKVGTVSTTPKPKTKPLIRNQVNQPGLLKKKKLKEKKKVKK